MINEATTISFETNGGTSVDDQYGTVESSPETTKDGEYFWGWYEDSNFSGEAVSFPYTPTSDTTLYARFEDSILIDGLSFESSYVLELGEEITNNHSAEQQYIYYSFTPSVSSYYAICSTSDTDSVGALYSYSEELLASNDDYYDSNFRIYYNLEANETYYIRVNSYKNYGGDITVIIADIVTYTFVLDDVTVDEISASAISTAPEVTKEGLFFWGWYEDSDFSGTIISLPYVSSTGEDITLYARFEDTETIIGGTSFDTSITVTTDTEYSCAMYLDELRYYVFVPTETATYVITSSYLNGGDPYCTIYDSNKNIIVDDDDNDNDYDYAGLQGLDFCIEIELTAGETYYIEVENIDYADTISFTIVKV